MPSVPFIVCGPIAGLRLVGGAEPQLVGNRLEHRSHAEAPGHARDVEARPSLARRVGEPCARRVLCLREGDRREDRVARDADAERPDAVRRAGRGVDEGEGAVDHVPALHAGRGERERRAHELLVLLPALPAAEGDEEAQAEGEVPQAHRRAERGSAEHVGRRRAVPAFAPCAAGRIGRIRRGEQRAPSSFRGVRAGTVLEEDVRPLAEADPGGVVVEGRRVRGEHGALLAAEVGGREARGGAIARPDETRDGGDDGEPTPARGSASDASRQRRQRASAHVPVARQGLGDELFALPGT